MIQFKFATIDMLLSLSLFGLLFGVCKPLSCQTQIELRFMLYCDLVVEMTTYCFGLPLWYVLYMLRTFLIKIE